jgi:hypothetical protein
LPAAKATKPVNNKSYNKRATDVSLGGEYPDGFRDALASPITIGREIISHSIYFLLFCF